MADTEQYLIQKRGLYYRPNAQGYTSSVLEAGIYASDVTKAYCCVEEGITAIPVSMLLPEIGGMILQLERQLEQWKAVRAALEREE